MLSIKNLTKIYKIKGGNDTVALDKVNIEFPEKGMVFLLGKSGSGKSTLLNLIGGLDFPTDGEIILKGRSSKDFSQSDFDSYRNTYIGFIFQEYNILNEFNVEQNIALAIELQGKKVTKEAVDKLLDQVDLNGFAKRKPNTLSGGQKQRIAIARALIKEPNIIMADEPTGALDSKTGEQVFETLKKLSADKLVIVVSHDRDFAERFGDRIIELKDGKILTDQTKHMVESTPISDNVTIINDHAIKINDAKKLTKKDFDQLYESIKNSDGKVFISSGENADKSMKVARISEDGKSDEFKETGDIEVKQYDPSQTTFIRSKMPISKSTKMGLSSLKTKPVRLVFTMLLSVISFTMFGVASALMLYNPNHTYSEALRKTDYAAETLSKSAVGRSVSQTLDREGNLIEEWSYEYEERRFFGVNEVKELNKNSLGLVYVPVSNCYSRVFFNEADMKNNANFYQNYYRINKLSDVSEEEFNKLGYHLDGQFPTKDDEIIVPKVYGQMLIDSGAVDKHSYLETIGQKVSMSGKKGMNEEYTVTGYFDAGDVPTKYFALNDENAKLTNKEKEELSSGLQEFFANSFNSVAFVTSKTFENNTQSEQNRSNQYVDGTYRVGFYIDSYNYNNIPDPDSYGDSYFTDKIVNNNKDLFKIYDKLGNAIEEFSINDDEIYLPKRRYEEVAYVARNSFYESFINLDTRYDSIVKYMPTYYAYISNEDNYQELMNLRNYYYIDREAAHEFVDKYIEEFSKAYKINKFIGEYLYTDSFNALPSEKQDLLLQVMNANAGANTAEQVQEVYNILDTYADNADACPNYLPYLYLTSAHNDALYSIKINNNQDLYNALNSDYKNWSNSTKELVINFLNENCQNSTNSEYRRWDTIIKGYTFKDFEPVSDKILEPSTDLKYYYASYNGTSGELKVMGYYELESNEWAYLLSDNFLLNNSKAPGNGDNDRVYRSYFDTKYEEIADARYENVMVKTDYTEEQIKQMFKPAANYSKYNFNSARYQSVGFVVSMISILKQVFFWIGVGFGVFAALMFLNFITVSIASKQKDIGILRAIGARKSDVFKIFFSESLFIATVCAFVALIFTFVAEFFLDRYFVDEIGISILQFNLATVGLVVAIALFIALVATIIPVLHSSKKPPVESIRAL